MTLATEFYNKYDDCFEHEALPFFIFRCLVRNLDSFEENKTNLMLHSVLLHL